MRKTNGFIHASTALFLVMLIFFGYLAIRISPPYYENYQVKQIMQRVVDDKNTDYLQSPHLMLTTLVKRFHVNQITNIKATDIITIREQDKLALIVDYQVKVKIFGNIYAVLYFNNKVKRM
ncbi:MAG: hypothetical protein CMF49_01380 [Legionellales bacterium]|nr:hypothetical protein [Legionellales bacterium]|tara:strand:+ start:464 stop:826 length:363 start_codon:yes stop_codon:yes gene_type:complete